MSKDDKKGFTALLIILIGFCITGTLDYNDAVDKQNATRITVNK